MKQTIDSSGVLRGALICLLASGLLYGCKSSSVKPSTTDQTYDNQASAESTSVKSDTAATALTDTEIHTKSANSDTQLASEKSVRPDAKSTTGKSETTATSSTSTKVTPAKSVGSESKRIKSVPDKSSVAKTTSKSSSGKAQSQSTSTKAKTSSKAVAKAKPAATAGSSKSAAIAKPASTSAKSVGSATKAGSATKSAGSATSTVTSNAKAKTDSKTKAGKATTVKSVKMKPSGTGAAGSGKQDKPEPVQVALAETPEMKAGKAKIKEEVAEQAPAIQLTADMLPYAFGEWILERNWDNKHPQVCRLRSEKTQINDGYDMTYLWAEILPDGINIYTGSNIDLEYEGSGLQFGFKPVVAFAGLLGESSVNVPGDFSNSLMTSDTMTVYIGFWPTWPKTETRKVTLSTQSLKQAIAVFQDCQDWPE